MKMCIAVHMKLETKSTHIELRIGVLNEHSYRGVCYALLFRVHASSI